MLLDKLFAFKYFAIIAFNELINLPHAAVRLNAFLLLCKWLFVPKLEYRGMFNELSVHLLFGLCFDQNRDGLHTRGNLADIKLAIYCVHMPARFREERDAVTVVWWSIDQKWLFVLQVLIEILLPIIVVILLLWRGDLFKYGLVLFCKKLKCSCFPYCSPVFTYI